MKIAIDISAVVYGTGVSVYTKNLVENILKIDKKNDYLLFGGSLRKKREIHNFLTSLRGNSVHNKVFSIPPTFADFLWNKLHILPIENIIGNIDVFHSSDWTQPPSGAFKVTTIHDLVPLKLPQLSDPKLVSTHKARLKWVKKEADRIIVPSQSTLEDCRELGFRKEILRVIPEATSLNFLSIKNAEILNLKRKYRISGKYILSVGVNPRKNTDRIIQAFEKIKAETGYKLVIIGHKYVDFHFERGVIFTGHISQEDLAVFYSGAEALVYPSLYEGFGIPILEAFVSKTPVVTTNFGSMAEIAGKAAVLVDPFSIDSIAEGILEAIKNKQKLVKFALRRAKNFSWEKTAKKTLNVYKEFGGKL